MSKSQTLGRKSFIAVSPIARHSTSCLPRGLLIGALCCALSLAALLPAASAQSVDTTSLEAYAAAIRHSVIADRISALQQFAASAGNSNLKVDALEFLVWDNLRIGDRARSASYAQELLKLEPANALALAVLSQRDDAGQRPNDSQFTLAKQGLNELPHLRKPEGMSEREFALLQKEASGMLHGAAGLGYLAQKDYASAKGDLQQAVSADPNNGRYVYGLAITLLFGSSPDTADGYLYLARAVNLNSGTPAGQQISEYARKKYQEEGGSSANWDKFLAAAAAATPNSAVATASPNNSHSATVTVAKANPGKSPKATKKTNKNTSAPAAEDTEVAENSPAEIIPAPVQTRPRRRVVSPTAPVSLGILIQTSLLTGENRRAIINPLSDMVRHLRENDEVFIMAYSDQLDFEQDLTAQDTLLQEAIDNLKPKSGAALFDGIAFAAGHLKRIGKNKNRVLLVISDGRNTAQSSDATPLSAQLSNVTVDCIGLDVGGASERDLLERLASYSGGHASFAADSQQFRAATLQIADSMGIEFPD